MRQSPPRFRERLANAIHASRTTLNGRKALRGLTVSALAGAFLAMSGAFGMQASLPIRLGYWIGLCVIGAVVGTAVSRIIGRDGRADERPWLYGSLVCAGITLPFTVVVWAISEAAFEGHLRLTSLPQYFTPVLVVTAAMTALNFLVQRRPAVTHAGSPDASPPRFLDRLPLRLRGAEIRAVEAQDHYLRLHTSRGEDLILMRLSDAITELEGIEGAQTHRSWWVAKDAVESARRGDGRATLSLLGGTEAPVSRAYAKALRDAGWF